MFVESLSNLNNSSVLSAISMIIMNIASKYLPMDIGSDVDSILRSPIMRKVAVFSILYVATRNFAYAVVGTFIFYIILKFLLNTNNKWMFNIESEKGTPQTRLTNQDIEKITQIIEMTKSDDQIVKGTYDENVDSLMKKLRCVNL